MVIVFILMISSATLEAQQNDKFYDLMTTIGEFFGGEFNGTEKALELDLNGTNSFLKELHTFATHKIEGQRMRCPRMTNSTTMYHDYDKQYDYDVKI
uniref:Uncharacterized protein n=1 Tax=Globodera rostochiensis TaxID=31243 RepID=A0A914H5L9_GLORO